MKISFTKMSGAGNDFVVIDNRSGIIVNGPEIARKLCDRRWGIGADGLLLVEKSRKAHYRMMYYNADGSYGGMCGNGGRCIAAFAVRHGLAPPRHSFEALKYIYRVHVGREEVTLWMKNPRELLTNVAISLEGKRQVVNFVDTGAPHAVVAVRDLKVRKRRLEDLDVVGLGRKLRSHRFFTSGGTNVNFIELKRRKSLKIRTYERGVENETLACGTGSIAAAVIAHELWGLEPPVKIVPQSHVPLWVNFEVEGDEIVNVSLRGPAEVIFEGKTELPSVSRLRKGLRWMRFRRKKRRASAL